jgi:hypothetical protein
MLNPATSNHLAYQTDSLLNSNASTPHILFPHNSSQVPNHRPNLIHNNNTSSYHKPKFSDVPSAISSKSESHVVVVRPISSTSGNSDVLDTIFTDHKARSLALRSSPFAQAGIIDLRINKQKKCLALEIRDLSKLPALSTIKKLGQWDITCAPPLRESFASAVIRRVPTDLTDEDILTELQINFEHVISATRLFRRDRDTNSLVKTGSIRIDFKITNSSPLPDRVCIYYELFNCELLVRNPLRCTKCQSFGHTTSSCRSKYVKCAKCSGSHNIDSCQTQLECCPNCQGNHPAYSKLCPRFSHARNVETISAYHRISYSDALKKVNTPSSNIQPVIPTIPSILPIIPSISPTNNPLSSISAPSSTTASSIPVATFVHPSAPMQPPPTSSLTNCSSLFCGTSAYPTLSDICPPLDLKQFILDIQSLFQRKLKDKPFQTALRQPPFRLRRERVLILAVLHSVLKWHENVLD